MTFLHSIGRPLSATCLGLSALLALSLPAAADSPWNVITADKGKVSEYVVGFSLNSKSDYPIFNDEKLWEVATALKAEQTAEASSIALDGAWGLLNDTFSFGGAGSTLAQHAFGIQSLSRLNDHMTNLGLMLGAAQVCMDISRSDRKAALANSFKTMQSYLIGRFGTSTMQVGAVAAFAIDYSLTKLRTTTWEHFQNEIGKAYRDYYEDEKGNKKARSIAKWKELVYEIYADSQKASSKDRKQEYFTRVLNKEIYEYAQLFWDDSNNVYYLAEHDYMTSFPTVSIEFRTNIEEKFRDDLKKQLIKRVFPEVSHRAWLEQIRSKLADMNGSGSTSLKGEFNKTFLLRVSAADIEDPAEIRIYKKDGTYWRATLQPKQTRDIRITHLAYIRAGFPTRIALKVGDKLLEESYSFNTGQAEVVFKPPQEEQADLPFSKGRYWASVANDTDWDEQFNSQDWNIDFAEAAEFMAVSIETLKCMKRAYDTRNVGISLLCDFNDLDEKNQIDYVTTLKASLKEKLYSVMDPGAREQIKGKLN